MALQKILIIQTAFIGDVILATSLVESLALSGGNQISFLVRKGNESLLENNPHLKEVLIWDKKNGKVKNLFKLLLKIRKTRYDHVINLQRFGATGLLTAFSKSSFKVGFQKNPFSALFHRRVEHHISVEGSQHEIERNHQLICHIEGVEDKSSRPRLYPTSTDYNTVIEYIREPYIVVAPGSVWYTKQMPMLNQISLLESLPFSLKVIFIGSKEDKILADKIILNSGREKCINLCGRLSFLQSAALMENAVRCVVNDSAPMHIASAMNAKTTAVFCSTVPAFGFGPLAQDSVIIETYEKLKCRPCGLHGKSECPEKHFDCGIKIDITEIVKSIGIIH